METHARNVFGAEELEATIAPALCADILSAAGDAGSVKSGLLGLATAGAWGWTLIVCYAAS